MTSSTKRLKELAVVDTSSYTVGPAKDFETLTEALNWISASIKSSKILTFQLDDIAHTVNLADLDETLYSDFDIQLKGTDKALCTITTDAYLGFRNCVFSLYDLTLTSTQASFGFFFYDSWFRTNNVKLISTTAKAFIVNEAGSINYIEGATEIETLGGECIALQGKSHLHIKKPLTLTDTATSVSSISLSCATDCSIIQHDTLTVNDFGHFIRNTSLFNQNNKPLILNNVTNVMKSVQEGGTYKFNSINLTLGVAIFLKPYGIYNNGLSIIDFSTASGDELVDWSLTNVKNIHTDNYTDTDTTYSVFTTTTDGLVPLTTTSNTTDFLRRDGTWSSLPTGVVDFADLGTTPTTIAGYGITDLDSLVLTYITSATFGNALPIADPLVIGKLWNNVGVLTISAG